MKNKIVTIILLVLIIGLLAYIVFKPKKMIPVTESDDATVSVVQSESQSDGQAPTTPSQTPVKKGITSNTITSNWKVFTGHGGISVTAPSEMRVNIDNERDSEILFNIESPTLGGISILKYPTKAAFDEASIPPTDADSFGTLSLVNDHYMVNKLPAKLYSLKDNNGMTADIIFIPSKLSGVTVVPSGKFWSGYSESDVNKMIQSITF